MKKRFYVLLLIVISFGVLLLFLRRQHSKGVMRRSNSSVVEGTSARDESGSVAGGMTDDVLSLELQNFDVRSDSYPEQSGAREADYHDEVIANASRAVTSMRKSKDMGESNVSLSVENRDEELPGPMSKEEWVALNNDMYDFNNRKNGRTRASNKYGYFEFTLGPDGEAVDIVPLVYENGEFIPQPSLGKNLEQVAQRLSESRLYDLGWEDWREFKHLRDGRARRVTEDGYYEFTLSPEGKAIDIVPLVYRDGDFFPGIASGDISPDVAAELGRELLIDLMDEDEDNFNERQTGRLRSWNEPLGYFEYTPTAGGGKTNIVPLIYENGNFVPKSSQSKAQLDPDELKKLLQLKRNNHNN